MSIFNVCLLHISLCGGGAPPPSLFFVDVSLKFPFLPNVLGVRGWGAGDASIFKTTSIVVQLVSKP